MILKKLAIQNFGPFALFTELIIDPEVTILTGRNDTGKSCILRLIELMCSGKKAEEDDINVDRKFQAGVPWNEDPGVFCIGTFIMPDPIDSYFKPREATPQLKPNDELDVKFYLAPQVKDVDFVKARRVGEDTDPAKPLSLHRRPKALYFPSEDEISTVIDIKSQNQWESALLSLAFGENFTKKLAQLGNVQLKRAIRRGSEKLTEKLSSILPPSMKLEFVLDYTGDSDSIKFIVSLRDQFEGDTSLHLRGSGVRKIVTLMAALLSIDLNSEQLYILFDEPENSLHADAQHMLRALLEKLATRRNIQVVYATHSPSMINPLKITGLRLLEGSNINDTPTSIVHNRPIKDNFYLVRSSLGLSPADSLLYAPITIIVEGPTEMLGLPHLLKRLHKQKHEGFELVEKLLSLSHFLSGQGASFEYWCRLAKSQGCKVIIFVDGDMARRINQQKVQEKHPDVSIVELEKGKEFEEIVQKTTYFQVLANSVDNDDISLDNFNKWEQEADLPEKMMFTKRIDKWLRDEFSDIFLSKPEIMRAAIEKEDLSKIDLKPFKELVNAMLKIMNDQGSL